MVLNDIIEQAAGRQSRASDLQGNFLNNAQLEFLINTNTTTFTWKFYHHGSFKTGIFFSSMETLKDHLQIILKLKKIQSSDAYNSLRINFYFNHEFFARTSMLKNSTLSLAINKRFN